MKNPVFTSCFVIKCRQHFLYHEHECTLADRGKKTDKKEKETKQ